MKFFLREDGIKNGAQARTIPLKWLRPTLYSSTRAAEMKLDTRNRNRRVCQSSYKAVAVLWETSRAGVGEGVFLIRPREKQPD